MFSGVSTIGYHVLFWVVIFLLTVAGFTLMLPLMQAIGYTLVHESIMIGVFYLNTEILIRRFAETRQWGRYGVYLSLLFVITLAVRFYIALTLKIALVQPPFSPRLRLAFFPFLTTVAVLAISIVYKLLENRYEREKQFLATIHAQNEAQLQWLRAQINPHFLFNVLNNIYALVLAKSDSAPAMILRLSELLRYIIYESRQQQVDLQQELSHIQQFIELFLMRFPIRQAVRFRVEGTASGQNIEPMILLPLVENCLKHCDFDTNEDAFITISVQIEGHRLQFDAVNTYNPIDVQKDRVGGVGLDNIQRRLGLTYPNRYSLTTQVGDNQFCVRLSIVL